MSTFTILWADEDRAYHVDEVYAADQYGAVAAGYRKHPSALHIRVI